MTTIPVQNNLLSLVGGMILNVSGVAAKKIISVKGDLVRIQDLRTGRRITESVAGLTTQIEYYKFYTIA
jgi:hypothetical protein